VVRTDAGKSGTKKCVVNFQLSLSKEIKCSFLFTEPTPLNGLKFKRVHQTRRKKKKKKKKKK